MRNKKSSYIGIGTSGSAFTIKYEKDADNPYIRVLDSDVYVSFPIIGDIKAPLEKQEYKKYKAIWDTGATCSAVTNKVVEELALPEEGAIDVSNTSGTQSDVPVYYVCMKLPNDVVITLMHVVRVVLRPEYDVLIGMDIIARSDFAITHSDTKTALSFCTPPVGEMIDFVPKVQFRSQFSSNKSASVSQRNARVL